MKHILRRAAAALLVLFLALSLFVPAFAAGDMAYETATTLGQGLTLTQLNSRTGSTRRQMFTLDYRPGGSVRPLVLYGDEIYGKSPVTTVIDYAESLGYHVLAAVNSDYFSTATGVPTGMTIQEGRLVTSDGSWNAVGFFEDGTAIVDTPRLSITLINETTGAEYPIYGLNGVRTNQGIYLYTTDFDKTTRTTAAGTEVVLELDSRNNELRLGKKVAATVASIAETTATPLTEGQMVLSLTTANQPGLNLREILSEGDEVTIRAATPNEAWEDVVWSTGGGNIIARGGQLTADANAAGREPRTLLGLREDGSILILECDGRQSALSSGLTLTEGAQLLLAQDCVNVINLDGGGSSIVAAAYPGLEPTVLSSPSDGTPRAGATYILFVATGKDNGSTRGSVVYPRAATLLPGAALEVSAVAYNRHYLGFRDVTADLAATDGWVEGGVFYAPDAPGPVTLTTGADSCQTALYTVTEAIESLKLTQAGKAVTALTLDRGQTADLDVAAHDGLRSIICQDTQFTFTVAGNIGTIDETGLFTAGQYVGEGAVTAAWGDHSVTIPVTVSGKTARLLEGFESGIGCGTFGSALSSAAILTDLTAVRYGVASLQLTYSGLEGDDAEYLLTRTVDLEGASHLSVTAKGAGNWAFLLQMADGSVTTAPFALTEEGWHTAGAVLPEGSAQLLGFACSGQGDFTAAFDQVTAHFGGMVQDTTPPVITIDSLEGTFLATVTDSGELPLTAADLTVTIDGAAAAFTFEKGLLTCVLPQDGSLHRITVAARDAMGNLSRQSAALGTLTSTFPDMTGHWAASYAQYLLQKGVFSPADKFNPETNVSNEMAATMLSRYLGVDTTLYAQVELPFVDAHLIADWALPHVKAMYALGIMKGSVDGQLQPILHPQASCSRAQIMTILGRTVERGYVYQPCTFTDAADIPDWAADHIDLLTALGVITGNDTGTVDPLGTITRAQFAALLYRMY